MRCLSLVVAAKAGLHRKLVVASGMCSSPLVVAAKAGLCPKRLVAFGRSAEPEQIWGSEPEELEPASRRAQLLQWEKPRGAGSPALWPSVAGQRGPLGPPPVGRCEGP